MAEQVICIIQGDRHRYSDCRCITTIKTDVATYTRLQAHEKVEKFPNSIFVQAEASRAYLITAEREGLKYVRTEPNDTTADNLLKVKDCP